MTTVSQRENLRERADKSADIAGISRVSALASGERTSREIFALNAISHMLEALRLEIRAAADR